MLNHLKLSMKDDSLYIFPEVETLVARLLGEDLVFQTQTVTHGQSLMDIRLPMMFLQL